MRGLVASAILLLAYGSLCAALPVEFPVKVLFGSVENSCTEGALLDSGLPFKRRPENGLLYGWKRSGILEKPGRVMVDTNNSTFAELQCEEQSVAVMQLSDWKGGSTQDAFWELKDIPNGKYRVTCKLGDHSYANSRHAIRINGDKAGSEYVQTHVGLFFTVEKEIEVTNEAIRVEPTGFNTKLSSIHIEHVFPGPSLFSERAVSTLTEAEFPMTFDFTVPGVECGLPDKSIEDVGEPYSIKQAYGLRFGWRKSSSPNSPSFTPTRRRAAGGCLKRGFAYMQPKDATDLPGSDWVAGQVVWQVDLLPMTKYYVKIWLGETQSTEGLHSISLNGEQLLPPTQQTSDAVVVEATRKVESGILVFSAAGGTNTKIQRIFIKKVNMVVPLELPRNIVFNVRPSWTSPCKSDEIGAFGSPFGVQPNGYTYGWVNLNGVPLDKSVNAVKRPATGGKCRISTYMSMQSGTKANFRIAGLPNGIWKVLVKCGDLFASASTHYIEANGVTVLSKKVQTSAGQIFTSAALVEVRDGEMIITAQPEGIKTKLNLIVLDWESDLPPDTEGNECVPNPSEFNGALISFNDCLTVMQPVPFRLDFSGTSSDVGIPDRNGVSTQFSMFLPSSNNLCPLDVSVLEVVRSGGSRTPGLYMKTRGATMIRGKNEHRNALGVGLNLPSASIRVEVDFKVPNFNRAGGQRACLWFGLNERKHALLCLIAQSSGFIVKFTVEEEDAITFTQSSSTFQLGAGRIFGLALNLLPETAECEAFAYLGGVPKGSAGRMSVNLDWDNSLGQTERQTGFTSGSFVKRPLPRDFFSFDAANQDFTVGTRSFAGPWIHQGSGSTATYVLTWFRLTEVNTGPEETPTPGPNSVDFDIFRVENVFNPTAMVMAPNDKLYVTNARCKLFEIEFEADGVTLKAKRTYEPLGVRLCLGVDVDPASTANNVILWISSSDDDQDNGAAFSGKISKVYGQDFAMTEDVVTGLPRAIANHAPNQLHWGPDGRLYLVVGGNTGGGAPNPESPTFGFRPEHCLTASMLVMDPKRPGFDGDCAESIDADAADVSGIASENCANLCDVEIFATGLRNSYDFDWRPNAASGGFDIFATDNGLGGTGTSPRIGPDYTAGNSCRSPVPLARIADWDPGVREDILLKVQQGKYYGHPNPTRRECIYYGGNPTGQRDFRVPKLPLAENKNYFMEARDIYPVGTDADPNYQKPEISFGQSKSANGIISYAGDAFCGEMKNDLLVTYYSQDDQVRWLHMDDNDGVIGDAILPRSTTAAGASESLRNPLSLTQSNRGYIYVGEFVGARLTIFRPKPRQCSRRTLSESPVHRHVDLAGASFGSEMYVFGGTDHEHQGTDSSEVFFLDVKNDRWERLPDLPYPARSMVAVAGNDSIFVFGGFSSGVSRDAVLKWELHTVSGDDKVGKAVGTMPESLGGSVGGYLEVIGAIVITGGASKPDGSPVSTTHLFDPIKMEWSQGPTMNEPRIYAAAAVVDGNLLVCGGLSASRSPISTCEIFDGQKWDYVESAPIALHQAQLVARAGKVLLLGGTVDGRPSRGIYEFDRLTNSWSLLKESKLGRSGAVSERFEGRGVYSFGGQLDVSFSSHTEVFEY